MSKVFIIAEAGLNFMGSAEKAIEYCEAAKEIGADAIKYQITDCDSGASKAELKKYELKLWEWKAIKRYCDKIGIEFIATPSSIEKLHYLSQELKCKYVKIGADRANDTGLVTKALSMFEKAIISEGGYTLLEGEFPKLIRMFCVSLYPTKWEWINWDYCTPEYKGWSDHTTDYDYKVVEKIKEHNIEYYEKHFKLDENCIDAKVSLDKTQFKTLIDLIRKKEEWLNNYSELEAQYG